MDYFNDKERAKQKEFAAKRDRIFSPLINLLIRYNATSNQISVAGVAFLIAACLMPPSMAIAATICMAMYVLCDGIDGPLARKKGNAHDGGSLIDIVADQLGVVFLPAAAIYHLGAWGPAMVVFASAYIAFIGLVVYANDLGVTLRKFIRSKYFFFLLYLGSLFLEKDLVSYFCAGFAVYYSVESFETLRRIYNFQDSRHNSVEEPVQDQHSSN